MRILDFMGTAISIGAFCSAWYFGKEMRRAKRDIGRSDMPASSGDALLRYRVSIVLILLSLAIGYGMFPDVFEKSPLEVFRQTSR